MNRSTKHTFTVFIAALLATTNLYAADWPSWGGQPSRNMASATEKGLPDWYALGGMNFDPAAMKNIKWVAKLGGCTCGSPIVSNGRVFIGTQGDSDNDMVPCLDEQKGRELGRFICRRPHGRGEHWGVCSTPTVEGDRLYLVTPYGEAVCVNLASWLTSHAAASAEESDRHIVWKYDMVEKLHVLQHHTASCSPLVLGEFVYVCTGNGRYMTRGRLYPLTPSLIAFNKHTGQLVAHDDEQIGEHLWRANGRRHRRRRSTTRRRFFSPRATGCVMGSSRRTRQCRSLRTSGPRRRCAGRSYTT